MIQTMTMTIREAWANGRSQLQHSSPSPRLDARLLLEHVLGVEHTYLIAHDDERLTAVQSQTYQQLINQAAQAMPIPYLIGHAPFFDLDFAVTPEVLIPRPETEQLVETAVAWATTHKPRHAVDIGTGSGCIAVMLARLLPDVAITAVDISPSALTIAQKNAAAHAPQRIQFQQGNLLKPVSEPIDLIVANLPYITDGEWTRLDDGVKLHEPTLALRGGLDGLDFVRELLEQATQKLTATGAIFLEIGWQQGQSAQDEARRFFPNAHVQIISDFAGHDRIVEIS